MGGQIWFESEPGAGATFTFTVWVGIGAQSGARKVIPEKLTALRVLIVDDNASAREIIDDLLKDTVRHADAVGSAAEALAAIRQHDGSIPYDVVFMDWRMPGMDGLQAARAIKDDSALQHPPAIIMVTAFGSEDVRDEAEQLQLDGFLVKPVTKSMVMDALINTFVEEGESQAVVSNARSEGVTLTGMRILLVEDNEINQQIAVELLEGVGASVTVVNHGGEALGALTGGVTPPPFDVVLMDLQMPVMDGHQATRLIRADARLARLPVIAMTAHATVEERDACLADGMNGHVSKPIEPTVLFATLSALHRKSVPTTFAPSLAQPAAKIAWNIPGLDTADGLARVADNEKLYRKLLRQFAAEQAVAVTLITEALAQGDRPTAARIVHTLKGLAGSLGAKGVQQGAVALETAMREQAGPDRLGACCRELADQLAGLLNRLRPVLAETPPIASKAVPTAIDPAALRSAYDRLLRQLAEFDPSSVDTLESDRPLFAHLLGATGMDEFSRLVQTYAFDAARALLERSPPPT